MMGRQIHSMVSTAGVVVALVGTTLWTSPASANCVGTQTLELYGTIPANGATDVPTNVAVIAFAPNFVNAELDGSALDLGYPYRWETMLPANSSIELVLRGGWESEDVETISFQTSDAVHQPDIDAPDIDGVTTSIESPGGKCPDLALFTGCPDTADPTWASFDIVEDPAAHGYFIRRIDGHPEFDQLWPRSCGTPLWNGYVFSGDCFEVQAIDEFGALSAPTLICTAEPSEDAGHSRDAGAPDSGSGESEDIGVGEDYGVGDDDVLHDDRGCATSAGGKIPRAPMMMLALIALLSSGAARRR